MTNKWDTTGDKIFNAVNLFILSVLLLIVAYPLWFVVIASFSDASEVAFGNVVLLPVRFTLEGYRKVLEYNEIWIGYRNSLYYTLVGTLCSILITMSAGFVLTRKDLPGRGFIILYLLIPMYFGGGMIPAYLNMRDLGLLNTWFVLLITGMVSTYYIIMARTFIQSSIPYEMYEAASSEGCSEFRYFFQFILPLSKALIACLAVFFAVASWNEYFSAIIYITDQNKHPIQVFLRRVLLLNTEIDISNSFDGDVNETLMAVESMKYGLIIVASLPVLLVYPFVQKYFMKGVMLGSFKG